MVWCWRITEIFWHSITPGVIYSHIRIQWMQLGDPTRVYCKNNFQNTIAKVNSSQFLVLDKFFRGQRTYFMCIYSDPRCATIVVVFTWIVNLILIMFPINEWQFLQLFLYQVTDYWRAYETISRQLGLRLLKSTQTTSDIFVIGTNVLTIPRSLKMVSIPWWKREFVYFVDIV